MIDPNTLPVGTRLERDPRGWNCYTPDGQHAHGPTIDEAYRNIGATMQLHPQPNGQPPRLLMTRPDGTLVSPAPIPPA